MEKISLFVGLKIPDTTAITAFDTLKSMGFDSLNSLERFVMYGFEVDSDIDSFKERIVKEDIVVNANKNTVILGVGNLEVLKDTVLLNVFDKEDTASGLLSTLKKNLGYSTLKSVKKSVLWVISTNNDKKEELAKDCANRLLCSPHYQDFDIL